MSSVLTREAASLVTLRLKARRPLKVTPSARRGPRTTQTVKAARGPAWNRLGPRTYRPAPRPLVAFLAQAYFEKWCHSVPVKEEEKIEEIEEISVKNAPPEEKQPQGSVTLYFCSGWPQSFLHYSFKGGEWKDKKFTNLPDSLWNVIALDLCDEEGAEDATVRKKAPLLEFVVTDNEGSWDKPVEGGNYKVTERGKYSVDRGGIEAINLKKVMVVSDLDGTMVGDDIASEAFKHFWGRQAALTDSKLVYNTGRSLSSFLKLLKEKKHCLAMPDVLISAVGTKIHMCEAETWPEHPKWAARLNQGWDVKVVWETAKSALEEVGYDNMHFRPEEEQNEHKITCGVKKSVLEEAEALIKKELAESDVKANLVKSGEGEWRFLDIVPKHAGKLEALDYVRKHYGFIEKDTVACGDSGNDILMLSGDNLAVVVGNAQPDLEEWLKKKEKRKERREQRQLRRKALRQARMAGLDDDEEPSDDNDDGGEADDAEEEEEHRLYFATKHEAFGILEGLKEFGFY